MQASLGLGTSSDTDITTDWGTPGRKGSEHVDKRVADLGKGGNKVKGGVAFVFRELERPRYLTVSRRMRLDFPRSFRPMCVTAWSWWITNTVQGSANP